MVKFETGGWHWPAFLLGPVWYLYKGMLTKGFFLLTLCIFTAFFAVPIVLIYCGAKGKGDWYDYRIRRHSKIDINKI